MAKVTPERLIKALGGKFSQSLGIDLGKNTGPEVFKWFLASKLYGARISSKTAEKTYREFESRGVLSPEGVLRAGWDGLVKILDAGGYVRYDFSTATKLLEITGDLVKDYGGDLKRLHEEARDGRDLEERLKGLGKGIGDVTVNIFLRELRGVWPKARPALSKFVVLASERLGYTKKSEHSPLEGLERFWSRERVPGKDFSDFEAALLRLGKDFCSRRKWKSCPLGEGCACGPR